MSPLVRTGDVSALRVGWTELRKTLVDALTAILAPVTRPRQSTELEPRFMAYPRNPRNPRTVVLHDRETDRLLPIPAGDESDVARLLCLYPGAFWSTESARAEVTRAIVRGEGTPVLPEVTL